jgi:acid phosphatase
MTPQPTPTPIPTSTSSSSTPPVPKTTGISASTPNGPGTAKVLVIVDENHTQAQAQASMPYLVSLQHTFGVTTHHTATTHPSLPNYLEIAGGSTFGVTDDAAPGSHPIAGVSVFGSALAQGKSARTYNESMSTACQQTSSGDYAVKHNPWAYFPEERTQCQANDLPLTSLPGDIDAGALPNVGMITPNLCNDGHDCTLGTADAFLQTWMPRIMSGPDYQSGRLTVVVTFDEGVGTDQTIQTVVVNPAIHAVVISAPLTHAGLSRWLYRITGSAPRNDAAAAADFGAAFGL